MPSHTYLNKVLYSLTRFYSSSYTLSRYSKPSTLEIAKEQTNYSILKTSLASSQLIRVAQCTYLKTDYLTKIDSTLTKETVVGQVACTQELLRFTRSADRSLPSFRTGLSTYLPCLTQPTIQSYLYTELSRNNF